jgi:anti-sigma28 factor (negative regulator of flagellin synthesis)
MRIDDLNLNRTPITQGAEKTDQAAEKRALEKNSTVADGTDQAEVSQLAKALSAGDPARLEQLRLQVQSGTYNVTSGALAESIINAHFKE